MRDCYDRITPDFEAWEKLGYSACEISDNQYQLIRDSDPNWDVTSIFADYDKSDWDLPTYHKEHQWVDFFSTIQIEQPAFTAEEQEQIEADIKNYREEIKKEL